MGTGLWARYNAHTGCFQDFHVLGLVKLDVPYMVVFSFDIITLRVLTLGMEPARQIHRCLVELFDVAFPCDLADKGSHSHLDIEFHDVGHGVELDIDHWVGEEHKSD